MSSNQQERSALTEMSLNKSLLPSAINFMGMHTDPNKIFQRKRQQSLTSSFIASPMVSLSRKRKNNLTDIESTTISKKMRIWNDFQDDVAKNNDIKMVKEYTSDIFNYFYKREIELAPSCAYTKDKHSIYYLKSKLRTILVDWLVQVHEKFQCVTETLLLAINIMDRFLSKSKVSTSKLQLVTITSLFIAAKFCEINLPKLSNYSYVTDGAATEQDIKNAEYQILDALNFEIAWPNPMDFIRRISKSDHYEETTRKYAKIIVEFAYCSSLSIELNPSLISVLAMFIAKKISKKDNEDENDEQLIKWLTPFMNRDDYHDLEDASIIIKKYSSLLIDEIVTPAVKVECLIQKFKEQNLYNDLYTHCKDLKKED
ncbi:S-phase entry cyclin-6 [Monosporozyma servazzii]